MDVLEEFKANLPEDTRAAVASMVIRLGDRDKQRLKTYLETGVDLPVITVFNIQHAFAEAGYPDTRWKRIMTRYKRMGHVPRYEFD